MSDFPLADTDCERAMLATVWLANDFVMVMRLDEADFVLPFHQWLFRHLRALVDDDQPLDMVALQQRLRKPGAFDGLTKLEVDGVKGTIAETLLAWAPPSSVEFYFATLREERLKRRAYQVAENIQMRLREGRDVVAVISNAIANLDRLLTKVPVKKQNMAQLANGDESPDAAKALAQPAIDSTTSIPAAARISNGSAERDRAGIALTK